MKNQKVRNASPLVRNGIKFRSLLERITYETLVQEGFHPEYEKHTYIIFEGFIPTVPFFTKNTLKRKDRRYEVIGPSTVSVHRPIDGITYTPDFYFEYEGKKVIVEAKGFPNDVYPYKLKMFRRYLEEQPDRDNYLFWEIHTRTQLIECIKHLRQLLSQ